MPADRFATRAAFTRASATPTSAVFCGGAAGARVRQRGAVSVMAVMLMATIGVAALVSIDIGYVFYGQRQLQKVADLAAVSGAQQLKRASDLAATSAGVLAAVQGAASQNGYPAAVTTACGEVAAGAADGMRACLGLWDPGNPANGDSTRHFNAGYNPATVSPNAVRVQATRTLPVLFVFPGSGGRQLRAEAIAVGSPPVASFSVGSGLLDVDTANSLLGKLLGPNVTVNFSAVDWSGLVGTNITLEQLRVAAGAGTIDQLLGMQLSLRDFYALVLKAANKSSLLGVAVGSPATTLGVGAVGVAVSMARLLALGVLAPAASSAAEVGLNVASLLMLSAQVANSNGARVDLGGPNLGIARASIGLFVTQPPQTAVGPVRQTGTNTWQTTARTAQLGLRLDVVVDLPIASVNLPLYVEVASATASLTQLQCAGTSTDRRATLRLTQQVAKVCLAKSDGSANCEPTKTVLANILGAQVVNVPIPAVPVGAAGSQDVVLAPGGQTHATATNPLSTAIGSLLGNLRPTIEFGGLGLPPIIDVGALVNALLVPVAKLLDVLVPTLLTPLGIQLGNADLWMNGIDCNNADLVY
ncbi:TadG family pilus assembly protein [Cupriavidus plantarum]|uniref:TadG family pilus assembly protein n=1 Tax=Cupriavidus plantarum TaxID=942865 RepID=UPI000F154996|nr:TadG family pilus assembly protein [Cupriavidus plantarum]RLK39590.1 putative membrane protein [Cupriavidus plantarum]